MSRAGEAAMRVGMRVHMCAGINGCCRAVLFMLAEGNVSVCSTDFKYEDF